jgi:hypothetical protein
VAYAEKRGKGPQPWRVKYKLPNGMEASESGFETKAAALTWDVTRRPGSARAGGPTRTPGRSPSASGSTGGWPCRTSASARSTTVTT